LDRAERTAFISFLIHGGLVALAAALALVSGSASVLALTGLLAAGLAASGLAWAGPRLSPRARGAVPAVLWNLVVLLAGVGVLWAAVAVVRALATPHVPRLPLAIGGILAAAVTLHVLSQRELFVGRESDRRGLIAAGRHSRMTTVAAAVVVAALAAQRMGFPLDRAGAVVVAAFVAATGLGMLASVAEGLRTGTPVEGVFPVRLARAQTAARRARRGGTLRTLARRVADALFHPAHRGHAARLAACGLALAWGLSAVSFVGPGQIGIVSGRGGERAVGPGVHLKSPWPFARAERVDAGGLRRASLGSDGSSVDGGPSWLTRGLSRLAASAGVPVREAAKAVPPRTEAVFLTGDGKLVAVEAVVHYEVDDPGAFAGAEDPDAVVARALESAVAAAVGASTLERVRASGRAELEAALTAALRRTLDALGLGVDVVAVRLGRILPPPEAASAFAAAASAADVAERVVVEETARAARSLSDARIEAGRMLWAADGYATDRRARAETDAARFLVLAPEYRKAKGVTETRLYIETMEELLAGIEKRIVGSGVTLEGYDPAAFDRALAPGAGPAKASGR
jgi:membrane protease subunit HflK